MNNRLSFTSILLIAFASGVWGRKLLTIEQDASSASNEVESSSKLEREQDVSRPVNLRYPSAVLFSGTCGGTIISPTWVLTAAHCTIFGNGYEILAGTNNTDNHTGVKHRVKRLVVHPLFTVGPYWVDAETFHFKQIGARWDFMLAELETPLALDGTVMAAAELDDSAKHQAGERVGFAGFGTDVFGGTMRSEMHAMDLEILSDKDCSTIQQYNPEDMLCVRGRSPRRDSACSGDSGSGLVRNGRLLGVLSYGEDDASVCEAGKKIVFARVAAAREWIRAVAKI